MSKATFRAMVRNDGSMVAALAVTPGGKARFFVVQPRESQELFVGRVSAWIKSQGAESLAMEHPDVLPKGVEVGRVLMQVRAALGVDRKDADAAEFDVEDPQLVLNVNLSDDQAN